MHKTPFIHLPWNHLRWLGMSTLLLATGLRRAEAHEPDAGVDVRPVRAERLANVPGQTLSAVTVSYAPGAKSTAHEHAGSVFAYVLTGAIRSENSATGPARVYQTGESFFEPAGSKHLISENASSTEPASLLAVFVAGDGAELTTVREASNTPSASRDLAHEIFETMLQIPGNRPGFRTVHAKGVVCQGTFTPSREAARLSKAVHFQHGPVPLIVRFSDGGSDPAMSDASPDNGPRGMAIRFLLPGDEKADLVAFSHNGFAVATGEEFLALQKAIVATDPTKPHPWPVEEFLGSHPRTLKFVQDNRIVPASFATEAFFANNAFAFISKTGAKQMGRYEILPVAGRHDLSDAEAKSKPDNFLVDDLKKRLAAAPIKFRLVVQLPNPDDATNDPSLPWPDDRRTIDAGEMTVTALAPENAAIDQALAFDPTNLPEGIELSDDPMPALRSKVYALAVKLRHAHQQGSVTGAATPLTKSGPAGQ